MMGLISDKAATCKFIEWLTQKQQSLEPKSSKVLNPKATKVLNPKATCESLYHLLLLIQNILGFVVMMLGNEKDGWLGFGHEKSCQIILGLDGHFLN